MTNDGQNTQIAPETSTHFGFLIEDHRLYSTDEIENLLGISPKTLTEWFACGLRCWRFGADQNSKRRVWGHQLKQFAEAWSMAMDIIAIRDERREREDAENARRQAEKEKRKRKGPPPTSG